MIPDEQRDDGQHKPLAQIVPRGQPIPDDGQRPIA